MKLLFVRMGINGEGIAYFHRQPVFCPGVLPGEEADVEIVEQHATYARARLKRLLSKSPDRVQNALSQEQRCSGAALSLLNPQAQLQAKQELLAESLWKYGHVSRDLIRPCKASPSMHYRSACKLPVRRIDGQLVNGMYEPGTNHFVPFTQFSDHTEELETLRLQVLAVLNRYELPVFSSREQAGLRYLVLRSIQHQAQLTLVSGRMSFPAEMIQELQALPGMTGVFQSINDRRRGTAIFGTVPRLLAGQEHLPFSLHGLSLEIRPASFFQLNLEQAERLYETAVQKIDPCEELVEAYCGIGVMSLMAQARARHITGIESIADAVKDARENARRNQITNVDFVTGDAAEVFATLKNVDTLLVDPPRTGLNEAMIEAVLQSSVERIIYVSCNPATLGRNLKELKHKLEVRTVIPFDMFPNTPQIESLTVLSRH